jgi:hypothetical protein
VSHPPSASCPAGFSSDRNCAHVGQRRHFGTRLRRRTNMAMHSRGIPSHDPAKRVRPTAPSNHNCSVCCRLLSPPPPPPLSFSLSPLPFLLSASLRRPNKSWRPAARRGDAPLYTTKNGCSTHLRRAAMPADRSIAAGNDSKSEIPRALSSHGEVNRARARARDPVEFSRMGVLRCENAHGQFLHPCV